MAEFIPYGRQSINHEDVQAVTEVLQSEFLTQGPRVPNFEQVVSQYCGAQYGIAVNSATSALHIACLALGVGTGDAVWTSAITFVASSNAALLCGASVDFIDIDSRTINLCVDHLEQKLKQAKKSGTLPKVVIPVHMCGQSCDMQRIFELSQIYGFRVLEDASHAVGASYGSAKVGQCEYSDITVFSFHPVKIITTGEGGMALTNNKELADVMTRLRSHGITRDPDFLVKADPEAWYYEQLELGLNYRMTDLAAALGISQMTRLDQFIDARRSLASEYHRLLSGLPLTLPHELENVRNSYHLYVVTLDESLVNKRREIFDSLRQAGIGVNVHYIPVYFQPYYQKLGFKAGLCERAERYYASCISLPMFPQLDEQQRDYVVASLDQAISQ